MTGDESVGPLDVLLAIGGIAFSFALFGSFVWLIVRAIRRRREDIPAAMRGYAAERGLTYEGDGSFDPVTPLLAWRGKAHGKVSGTLAPGFEGELAHYRYDRDASGGSDFEQTVVLAPLPEAGRAKIYLVRRGSYESGGAIEDAMTQYQSVRIESAAFGARYQLRVRDSASMIAIRQLFSPSFIVFLTERAPDGFWFEIEGGHLCAARYGAHWRDPDALDELCRTAAAVRGAVRADIRERLELRGAATDVASPPPPPAPAAPPPPPA